MYNLLIPQGPWHNPKLDEGVYDAVIKKVTHGVYGKNKDLYVQFAFWLPDVDKYVVSNFYFPKHKKDSQSVKRLLMLCKCFGRIPQEAIDNPQYFEQEQLQITIKVVQGVGSNEGCEYCDIEYFLPAHTAEI